MTSAARPRPATEAPPVRAMSFGGGVQSTAMLVLAAEKRIDYALALFCNVGDDSEHPDTLAYVRDHSQPYAEAHGIDLVTLRKTKRDGSLETVYSRVNDANESIGIPVRMSSGAPASRHCTIDFKVRLIAKELKRRGATKDAPATVALGISIDEYHRMRSESGIPHEVLDYPLIDARISRKDCLRIVRGAGLPAPPKSSCWFCPYHTVAAWSQMREDRPDLFAASVAMERRINVKREALGQNRVFFSSRLKPLDLAISEPQPRLFRDDDAACDIGGYCGV